MKPPPIRLKQLIELVNCFPMDTARLQQMNPIRLVQQAFATRGELTSSGLLKLNMLVDQSISDLPTRLREYVFSGKRELETQTSHGETIDDLGMIERYENLWYASLKLRAVALLARTNPDNVLPIIQRIHKFDVVGDVHISNPINPARGLRSALFLESVRLPIWVQIDEQGIVRVSKDLFSEAVEDEGVEAARIRECEVCTQIFWAGRIDQPCCSKECSHVRRNRLYRARYKEGYYQGAKLTPQERKALKTSQRTSKKA